MLERRSRDREIQCILLVLIIRKTVDDSGREAVASAYTVDDIGDFIMTGEIESCFSVQGCRPSVVVGALGFAQPV